MTRFRSLILVLLLTGPVSLSAQEYSQSLSFLSYDSIILQDSVKPEYPDPSKVLKRSLIIPGWGQITNKQAWKVPIVYGLLGGLTYYSMDLTVQYHDYRAAFYNQYSGKDDLKFGATPDFLQGQSRQALRNNRDFLRNRRDFIYVTIALAYMLNVVDAYVFAHLRSFDVSDDLSLNHTFKPSVITSPELGDIPSVSLKISF